MQGQPPSMTPTPCCRPYSAAVLDTLPAPGPRCIQTCLMPSSSAHSRIVVSAVSGLVSDHHRVHAAWDRGEVVVAVVALDLIGVGIDRKDVVAAVTQPAVDDVGAVILGLSQDSITPTRLLVRNSDAASLIFAISNLLQRTAQA